MVVYEALHHAYDWEKFVQASYRVLNPGGWLLICNEPNLAHTIVSYRIAKLSNTHEIGMSASAIRAAIAAAGFGKAATLSERVHWYAKPHWIVAQKS